MKIENKIKMAIKILVISLFAFSFVKGQSEKQPRIKDDSESLRKILLDQPNYFAHEEVSITGIANKREAKGVAKVGNRLVHIFSNRVLIFELGKPIISITPAEKKYTEIQNSEATASIFRERPEIFAKSPDFKFKLVGEDKENEYPCLLIQVILIDKRKYGREWDLPIYCVAPSLNNLVVSEDTSILVTMGNKTRTLKKVSLDVSEETIRIPADFKKSN